MEQMEAVEEEVLSLTALAQVARQLQARGPLVVLGLNKVAQVAVVARVP
jgi:hypothetical protein